MPISLRKLKLTMNYWIHVKGHSELHPVKDILKDCWEYGNNKIKSFGWTASRDATILGTKKKLRLSLCCNTEYSSLVASYASSRFLSSRYG